MTFVKAALSFSCAALALTGCDAATQVAGDAIKQEVRNGVVAQCEQVAENTGIAAERIAAVCDCSADAIINDAADGELQIDQARVEEVLNTCAQTQQTEPANG